MGQSHSAIKSQVMEVLSGRGWPVLSFLSNGYTGPATTDNLACVAPEGWFLAIEVKTPGDHPNPKDPRWIRQQRFMRRVRDAGGIAVYGESAREIVDKIDMELVGRRRHKEVAS